jgi:hypothetical protein
MKVSWTCPMFFLFVIPIKSKIIIEVNYSLFIGCGVEFAPMLSDYQKHEQIIPTIIKVILYNSYNVVQVCV